MLDVSELLGNLHGGILGSGYVVIISLVLFVFIGCINCHGLIARSRDLSGNLQVVDQELCSLKTRYEVMEQKLKNTRTELTRALNQCDKYKEERDELCKLVEY